MMQDRIGDVLQYIIVSDIPRSRCYDVEYIEIPTELEVRVSSSSRTIRSSKIHQVLHLSKYDHKLVRSRIMTKCFYQLTLDHRKRKR